MPPYLGQGNVEVAEGCLWGLGGPGGPWLAHERKPSEGLLVGVLDPHSEGQPVLSEGLELQLQLLARFGHWHQVAPKLQVLALLLQHLRGRRGPSAAKASSLWPVTMQKGSGPLQRKCVEKGLRPTASNPLHHDVTGFKIGCGTLTLIALTAGSLSSPLVASIKKI